MSKDRNVVLNTYTNCRCGGHTCHRCMTNAAQLRAWNMEPVSKPAEREAVDEPEAPKQSKKKTKEDKN